MDIHSYYKYFEKVRTIMVVIALMDRQERALLIRETARVSHLSEAIVEKDYWVCFVLE